MASLTGRRLAALLEERGMTQKQLAEVAGLTPAAVCRYVSGAREPRAITVAAMARALGVAPAAITGTDAEKETDDAVRLIARNASSLTEAQRAELIAALAKR
jgi:transcriptional regulator with XRE-family HTH domain